MEQNGWIALGAVSALGFGALAGGAVAAATVMPLLDSSSSVAVAPISDLRSDVTSFAGTDEARATPPSGSPAPGSSAAPTVRPAPTGSSDPEREQVPALPPVPVAPAPSPISIDTPPSAEDGSDHDSGSGSDD